MLECEFCSRPAVGEAHAQWTLFDFLDLRVCEDHYDPVVERFWKMYVDGNPPVDVWMQWYLGSAVEVSPGQGGAAG